ncbi:MAG TPA: membrane protein insertase YidC [Anaerolineae bacterium]|nr:membrane protein insertase YidC [Anaerolineae bacterium]
MNIWATFVETLVVILFELARVYGGNVGLAIITLSLLVRLALLPITLRTARRAQARQAQLKGLQPEIERLKQRYRAHPERLAQELAALYQRRNYRPFDRARLLSALIQLPIFAGLYSALQRGLVNGGRFLWIGNLAQPDLSMTLIVAGLTYAASTLNPGLPQNARLLSALLPSLLTAALVWQLAAGFSLYWATSSAIGLLQTVILRRNTA